MAKKKAITKKKTTAKAAPKAKAASSNEKPRGFTKPLKLVVVPAGKKYVAALKYNGKLIFSSEPMSSEGHALNFAGRLADWLKKPDLEDTTLKT